MPNIVLFCRNLLSKSFLVGAFLAFLSLGFLSDFAAATSFSQRARLEMSGGYNFARHKVSHYAPYFGAPDTSTLLYTRHRGEGRAAFSWSGFWKLDEGKQGLYLRSVPAVGGGASLQGNLSDKDFCDSSKKTKPIEFKDMDKNIIWTCPQQWTLWSDTDSPVRNWFLSAEIDNVAGFFLQNPDNDERFFGAGLSFGYNFLHENDLAQGVRYNTYLLPDPNNRRPPGVLLRGGQDVIGNKVFWHALKVGLEIWTEQIPPRWRQPVIANLAVHYIPYAYFLEEDSHFLRVGTTRDDLGPVPNIIAEGTGQGVEVKGSLFVPFPVSRPPRLGLLLQARWQRLFLKQGYDTFHFGDGSSSAPPLTEFTTESFSVSTGFTMTW